MSDEGWKQRDIIELLSAEMEIDQSIARLSAAKKKVDKAAKARITEILDLDDVTDELSAEVVELLSDMRDAKKRFGEMSAPMKEEKAAIKTAIKDRVDNQTPQLNFGGDDD